MSKLQCVIPDELKVEVVADEILWVWDLQTKHLDLGHKDVFVCLNFFNSLLANTET